MEPSALTSRGQSLAHDSTSRLAEKVQIVVEQYWQPWAKLVAGLKTGKPAFEQVFGMSVGDWRRAHAEQGALFDAYVAKETLAQAGPIIAGARLFRRRNCRRYRRRIWRPARGDPASPSPSCRHPVRSAAHDRGGAFLPASLKAWQIVSNAWAAISWPRFHVQADLYLLKGVLQQWDDEEAVAIILQNCRNAMPDGAKLVIVERLLPERATDDPAAIMLDLHMMTITGGRARSLADVRGVAVRRRPRALKRRPHKFRAVHHSMRLNLIPVMARACPGHPRLHMWI